MVSFFFFSENWRAPTPPPFTLFAHLMQLILCDRNNHDSSRAQLMFHSRPIRLPHVIIQEDDSHVFYRAYGASQAVTRDHLIKVLIGLVTFAVPQSPGQCVLLCVCGLYDEGHERVCMCLRLQSVLWLDACDGKYRNLWKETHRSAGRWRWEPAWANCGSLGEEGGIKNRRVF